MTDVLSGGRHLVSISGAEKRLETSSILCEALIDAELPAIEIRL